MKLVFEIVSKVKKESADKGTKYEARFKSSEGHRLSWFLTRTPSKAIPSDP
jgi:hypothetical protein